MLPHQYYSRRQVDETSRAARLWKGANVHIRRTPFGNVLNFRGGRQDFSHPWMVILTGGDTASVQPGTINRVDATIKGVPLWDVSVPELEFGKLKVDAEGRGYICAEVTCKPEEDWKVLTVEIVQVADPDSDNGSTSGASGTGAAAALNGNRARHPLAMIRERKDGRFDVYQVTYFDLQHRVSLAADGRSAQRHFFW